MSLAIALESRTIQENPNLPVHVPYLDLYNPPLLVLLIVNWLESGSTSWPEAFPLKKAFPVLAYRGNAICQSADGVN